METLAGDPRERRARRAERARHLHAPVGDELAAAENDALDVALLEEAFRVERLGPERLLQPLAGGIHRQEDVTDVVDEHGGLACCRREDEGRHEDGGVRVIAVDHDVEDTVAVEIGQLHAEDPASRAPLVGPLRLELLLDDLVEEYPLTVGDHHARAAVPRRHGDVHADHAVGELRDLLEGDLGFAARVRPCVELAREEPGEERLHDARRLALLGLARGGEIALGPGLDRGREEQRGGQQRAPAREGEEPDVHVGLLLDPRVGDDEQVLDLEPLADRREAVAVEHVLALDALLAEPHADRVAEGDLEPPRLVERLDQLVRRCLGEPVLDAVHER